MIVVAGLTPAWQKILRFRSLRVGEVNRAVEAHWCASGKVLNVGIAASLLGANCRTVSPVGGPARDSFEREFASLGVEVDWVSTDEPTRVCTSLLDEATGTTTELVENARAIDAAELETYRAAYARAAAGAETAVWTGSLPVGTPPTFYRDLLASTPGRIIVDARGPELLALLDAPRKPTVVKPNREELAATVGRPLATDADLHSAMRELCARGPEWVVVTQGAAAVWAANSRELWRAVPPRADKVVNPIGCGDCLAAGLAVGLDRGDDFLEALKLGIAAACENLSTLEPARIRSAEVLRLLPSIECRRVG